jgi:hypothetical protein
MIKRYVAALAPDAGGTPNTYFDTTTFVSDNASYDSEIANLKGSAGATLTIQMTTYTNTNNMGQVKINGNLVYPSYSFAVVLDGSGDGSFAAYIQGNAGDTGTVVRAIFTIVGMSAGFPSSPITYEISKVF